MQAAQIASNLSSRFRDASGTNLSVVLGRLPIGVLAEPSPLLLFPTMRLQPTPGANTAIVEVIAPPADPPPPGTRVQPQLILRPNYRAIEEPQPALAASLYQPVPGVWGSEPTIRVIERQRLGSPSWPTALLSERPLSYSAPETLRRTWGRFIPASGLWPAVLLTERPLSFGTQLAWVSNRARAIDPATMPAVLRIVIAAFPPGAHGSASGWRYVLIRLRPGQNINFTVFLFRVSGVIGGRPLKLGDRTAILLLGRTQVERLGDGLAVDLLSGRHIEKLGDRPEVELL
jgi:hypothetical protein